MHACAYKSLSFDSGTSITSLLRIISFMGQLASHRANDQTGAGFQHTDVPAEEAVQLFQEVDQTPAFRETLCSKRFVRSSPTDDMDQFLTELVSPVGQYIAAMLRRHHAVKVAVFVHPRYEKISNTGPAVAPSFSPVLRTKLLVLLRERAVDQTMHSIVETLRARHANFMREKSGLRLEEVRMADVQIAKVEHFAYSGRGYTPLPKFLLNKKAIVNVKNTDERCFGYALLSALHPDASNVSRPSSYDRYFRENTELDSLQYPVQTDQFEDVENRLKVPFNVFTYYDDEGRARYPLYLSRLDPDNAKDLLFWNGHYAWIKSFTGFLADQYTSNRLCFYCKRCFGRFTVQSALDNHKKFCTAIDACQQIYTMPAEGTKLKFRNVRHQAKFPFVIYADFEALTVPCTRTDSDTELANCYQKHEPISVGLKLISTATGVLELPYESHMGADVATWLLNRLLAYRDMAHTYLFDPKRLVMTVDNQVDFESALVCYICGKQFPDEFTNTKRSLTKVRDHDHLTGKYRGAAHSQCNLNMRKTYKIPVFIHNFRGYDSHLIVPAFTQFKGMVMQVIGQGLEKYMSLTWDSTIVFKDSLQFLGGSLEALVECLLKSGKDKFHALNEAFRDETDDEGMDKLLRKGVYPYDYMNNEDRFKEQKLPERAAFFSRLTNTECSEANYKHAEDIWEKFKCKTMRDYHDLYLKMDVLLLADVFESFRSATLSTLGLDPAYYVSGPQLSWDCMMKMTRCQLTLLNDPEMFNVLNANLRGGITMITKRYAKANNKYLHDAYNPAARSSYIIYLDANNLYGHAMSQPLPYDEFTWMSEAECQQVDWLAQTDDQPYGYFVECDLHYPDELHNHHNDYPLAAERIVVEDCLLSETQENIRERYAISHAATAKLIPNFFDKKKMLIHYRNLRFYLEHGLQVTKMHRAIRFKQMRWLEPYIRTNTELRAKSKDPVETTLRKNMNNNIYGKTCENLTKRTDIRLVNTQKECDKLICKPHCLRFRVFAEELAGIELQKVKCMINKPTYVGFAVLELSKLCMYEFHYDYFKQWYPDAELLFTDTDSLLYHVYTDDLYADLASRRQHFDFSGYPAGHALFGDENKMVVGKMKDEAGGKIITEFVGLRPKMYSYLTELDEGTIKEAKRAKGIQRAAMTDVRHANYLAQLHEAAENYVNVRRIGQKHHRVFTVESVKRGLCAFDDKRYLLPDGIHTLAHGHYNIREEQARDFEFDETVPESILSSMQPPTPVDDSDSDVTGFTVLSYIESVRLHMRPCISDEEAIAMIGGVDLREEINELETASNMSLITSANADTVPKRARINIDVDDVNENDDLRSIVGVASMCPMNDMY